MSSKKINQEAGQSLIEYTLLLGLLALAMFAGVSLLGANLDARFALIDSALAKVAQADTSTPDRPASDDQDTPDETTDQDDEDDNDDQDDEDAPEKPSKPEKPGKPEKPSKPEKPGKPEKPLFPWLP